MKQKEKELIKKIEEETKNVEVPKSLQPEAVEKKLSIQRREKQRHRFFEWKPAYTGGLVAAAFLVLLTGAAAGGLKIAGNEAGYYRGTDKVDAELSSPENYEELYTCIQNYEKQQQNPGYGDAVLYSPKTQGVERSDSAMAVSQNAAGGFSDTNIRQEGVAEGDTVKTDGSYLYILEDTASEIHIVDIRKETMTETSQIVMEKGAQISEFYIQDEKLIVCATFPSEESGIYMMNTAHAITYDISDPGKPVRLGEVSQSGFYKTSRISEGYLYLLSDFYVDTSGGKENPAAYVPEIGGGLMPPDKIYLPPDHAGCRYVVVTSVSLEEPGKTKDSKGIFYDGDTVYVSNDNMYFAAQRSASGKETETVLQKLSYRDGELKGVAQASVKGYLEDSFALDEYEGYLRMVVTRREAASEVSPLLRSSEKVDTGEAVAEESNSVYVLDEELKIVGSIDGLAENERVYASRFMGDTGYFVTFRQTDPLFTVDLSDPRKPEIVGKLKIPGFSDYLHPYGEGLLFGIGLEMDTAGVTTKGVKLSMYDVSDPYDVKEVHKYVLEDMYSSPAMYDYKAVLADVDKNFIGFSTYGEKETYCLFSYDKKDGFQVKLKEPVNNTSYLGTKGVYAGERLYVVGSNAIESYRMTDYKKVDDLLI